MIVVNFCNILKCAIMSNTVGNNLKVLREANRLTQEKVADFLGVKRSTYSNYESGEREAPIEVLESASKLFGCELSTLFSEDKNALQCMLASAFRADGLCESDMREVAAFKGVVMNYIKMLRLMDNE